MSKPRVSLCLIARNEERDIGDCIRSALPACDEVVLADTGSTDRTREIAAELGAKIVDFPWCDDFAAARNASLDAATGDWALILDCDERLSPEAAKHIRKAVRDRRAVAFRLDVVSDVGGGVQQCTPILRLFRRVPEIRYVRRIHESVGEAVVAYARKHGLGTEHICGPAYHSGYEPTRFQSLGKRERNLRLHQKTIEDRPNDAYAWYRYGDELRAVDAQRSEEALDRAWSEYAAMDPQRRSDHVYGPEIVTLRAFLQLKKREVDRALETLEEGERIAGASPNFVYVRAIALSEAKRFEEALACFVTLRGLEGEHFETPMQPRITTSIACAGAGSCCEQLGRLEESERWLRQAIELDPEHVHSTRLLARVLGRLGRALEGERVLVDWLKRHPKDAEAWAIAGKLALQRGASREAVQRLSIALCAPDAPDWAHEELSMAQAAQGNFAGALSAAEKVKSADRRAELERAIAAVRT